MEVMSVSAFELSEPAQGSDQCVDIVEAVVKRK
jgi:hypothetical protein